MTSLFTEVGGSDGVMAAKESLLNFDDTACNEYTALEFMPACHKLKFEKPLFSYNKTIDILHAADIIVRVSREASNHLAQEQPNHLHVSDLSANWY